MKKNKWILPAVLAVIIVIFLIGRNFQHQKDHAGEQEAETTLQTEKTEETPSEETEFPQLPDSVLYYGEIKEILPDEDGFPRKLRMDSPKDGEYIMELGENTAFILSGERKSFDPKTLQEGDRVYVFLSPIAAQTLPPQSAAFAVLKDVPMDASCGMYHEAEKLTKTEGTIQILTDNGEKTLELKKDAKVLDTSGEETDVSYLKEGNFIIAWYWDQGQEIIPVSHIMILP